MFRAQSFLPAKSKAASSPLLRGATGKVVWHRQLVHHDIWDWDVSSPPMLIDIRKDGKVIPAVVQNNVRNMRKEWAKAKRLLLEPWG